MIKKNLMNQMQDSKKYIFENIGWQWLALVCNIGVVCSAGMLIERGYHQKLTLLSCFGVAGMVLGAVGLRFICQKKAARASFQAGSDVKRVLRQKLYQKLLRLGTAYHEQVSTAEVVQMSVEGIEQLEVYFGRYLPQLFYSMLAPLTLFSVLSFINVKVSVILLICVPLIPLSIVAVQKIAKRLLNKYWKIYTGLGDSFLENLQGLTTLKIFQADEQKVTEMDIEAEQFRKITMRVLIMQLNSTSVMDIVAYGGAALGMIVALREFLNGNITIGGTFIILLLSAEFFTPMRMLGSLFHIAMNGMTACDKIFHLFDLPEETDGQEEISRAFSCLEMEDINFSYGEKQILKNISLFLPERGLFSLVGSSGCGKSTIASLMTGNRKGYQGKIFLNQHEILCLSESSRMNLITFISHDSYLFKGTVEDNLRMAAESASKDELELVLYKVGLLDFFRFHQGLETRIEEAGKNLSGGQRQRLALARALLHDSPFYIFDEATSNIDVESEHKIMELIHQLAKEKCVLLISHRLANVVNSDWIYVMAEGAVKEQGRHYQLIEKGGIYETLYNGQAALEHYGVEDELTAAGG